MSTTKTSIKTKVNDNGVPYLVKANVIYAPRGQAGEYAPLALEHYRGCGIGCKYCLAGDTLLQMADGSVIPISDVKIGDKLIGIDDTKSGKRGAKKITTTEVLAKVVSHKPAYRVTLASGRQVVCSEDHRWLTDRGWKYTKPLESGQRPYLTTSNYIRSFSDAAVTTPNESKQYMLGYLAGMITGDAHLDVHDYSDRKRPNGKTMGVQHHFRLALKDSVAIDRVKSYLAELGIYVDSFVFNSDGTSMDAIRTNAVSAYYVIKDIADKRTGNEEWHRGWLAGIFDAEGSHKRQALRITNSDESVLNTIRIALDLFDIPHTKEFVKGGINVEVYNIRLLGGRNVSTRFWHLVNPAIKRKFDPIGESLQGSDKVVSIEPLGETIQMFDIMTTTENFIANGLVSHNCYVPNFHNISRQTFNAGGYEIPNVREGLTNDVERYVAAGIENQVMLSFSTDPYHTQDTTLTRECLAILSEGGMSFCTLSKGGKKALRDIDLFRPEHDAYAITLTTLDDEIFVKWEPNAASPTERIDTLEAFAEKGVYTWISLEPTLDTATSLQIIESTHHLVDRFKIGRANYLPGFTDTIDWEDYTLRVIDLCERLGVDYYIKRDLQDYIPKGHHHDNAIHRPQHN